MARSAGLDVLESKVGRSLGAIGMVIVLLVLYSTINGRFESRYDLGVPLDSAIPLLPWTLPIYASLYVVAPLGSLFIDGETFRHGMRALMLVALMCFAGFVLVPAAYPRPDITHLDSIWRPALQFYYENDPPTNTFPSLHVATATIMAWMLRTSRARAIWWTWCGLIALTTLTTKQHFIVDVVGGIAVAVLALTVTDRLRKSGDSCA